MKQQPKNMREARLQHQTKKSGSRVGVGFRKKAAASTVDISTGNDKGFIKTYLNRGTVIGAFVGTALAISVPTIAEEVKYLDTHENIVAKTNQTGSQPGTGSTNVLTTGGTSAADGSETAQANQNQVAQVIGTTDSTVAADVKACAEGENGLVKAAADALNIRTQVLSKYVDVNQIFQPKKQGGCFADLGDIPDLSITIPTWSGMADKLIGALKDYASKKVCDAVYEASEQVIGPIRESMNEIQNYSQSYDFAKEFAEVTGDKWGIDSGIFMPDKTTITYDIDGYTIKTDPSNGGSVTGGAGGSDGSNGPQTDDPYAEAAKASTASVKSNSTANASNFFGN
ncbi:MULTISPECIES: hypothetical protein [Acinetobacter]|uniref:Uncharacterized protein n=1 Tax=Acinetobacter indicus TaxID=756892 RepID=A0A6C0Y609_9GAMM|nr:MULTISPECIES: hypothetical protein [Acinetobacter]QIC71697.1 hypothetical protein FSC09_14980 [Acinetobacter indicus]QKQ71606.1 hypothetical protein E5Y90_15345 [Acinetobacter sp. 10FS3-1]